MSKSLGDFQPFGYGLDPFGATLIKKHCVLLRITNGLLRELVSTTLVELVLKSWLNRPQGFSNLVQNHQGVNIPNPR